MVIDTIYGQSSHELSPTERVRPRPRLFRFEQSKARPDEVIGRSNIVGRVRDHSIPAIPPHLCLRGTDESQLQISSAMTPEDTDPREIAGVEDAGRRDQTSKANWYITPVGEPPMTQVEIRDGRRVEERKTVDLSQNVGDILIVTINRTNPVHLQNPRTA
jgi:hypothetical protein